MTTTFIYTLADPRTNLIRYVGKTDAPASRAKSHLRRDRSIKAKWIQSLVSAGVHPVLEILDEVPFEEWMLWEQYWITVMRGWGFDLVNGDNGGLGHYRLSAEIVAKISKTLKGRPIPDRRIRVYSYHLDGTFAAEYPGVGIAANATGAHHANISRGARKNRAAGGFLWSYERKDAIDTPYINGRIPVSDKHRDAARLVGLSRRGLPLSPRHRAILSAAALRKFHVKGWTHSEEGRKKMSEASRKWHASKGHFSRKMPKGGFAEFMSLTDGLEEFFMSVSGR